MSADITVRKATVDDAPEVAAMMGELLAEIMPANGVQTNFDLVETIRRLTDFLNQEKYVVFVALDGKLAVGFLGLYEGYALYAEGAFGTIAELYVRPPYRSGHVGSRLIFRAKALGQSRGWTRLEVTTPPLPKFDRTLAFYEREGLSISGGRKLKIVLEHTLGTPCSRVDGA